MSRKGNCWDNAVAESFFHSIKIELIYGECFNTRRELQYEVFDYIEKFYNQRRRHSSIGYLSPVEFEMGLRRQLEVKVIHSQARSGALGGAQTQRPAVDNFLGTP